MRRRCRIQAVPKSQNSQHGWPNLASHLPDSTIWTYGKSGSRRPLLDRSAGAGRSTPAVCCTRTVGAVVLHFEPAGGELLAGGVPDGERQGAHGVAVGRPAADEGADRGRCVPRPRRCRASTSIRGSAASSPSASRRMSSRTRKSATTQRACNRAAIASARTGLRPTTTTSAPRSWSCCAAAAPVPELAPVTTTVAPVRSS
jgi:hypothetical protein